MNSAIHTGEQFAGLLCPLSTRSCNDPFYCIGSRCPLWRPAMQAGESMKSPPVEMTLRTNDQQCPQCNGTGQTVDRDGEGNPSLISMCEHCEGEKKIADYVRVGYCGLGGTIEAQQ